MAVPGAWSITLPANRGSVGTSAPLIQWTAASGAVTYTITIQEETAPGSETFGSPGRTIAWSLIAGTSLQLPGVPAVDAGGSGGYLRNGIRHVLYGIARNADGDTGDTTPDTDVWDSNSFTTRFGGRSRSRARSR